MATIVQILPFFWPGQGWSIDGDDYETLNWAAGNSMPKPTEAEIRTHSAEVDALVADKEQRERQQSAMADAPDYLLKGFEDVVDALIEIRRVVNDIRTTTIASAHTGSYTAWDSTIVARIAAIRQWLTNKRNLA